MTDPRPRKRRGRPPRRDVAPRPADSAQQTSPEAPALDADTLAAAVTTATDGGPQDPPPDPPKKRRGRPPGSGRQAGKTREIEEALTALLTMPSIPFMLAGEEWPANHFATRGPELAAKLAAQSERSPALRRVLERFTAGEATASLVFAVGMYAIPPMMYFGLVPTPPAAAIMMGVPDRQPMMGGFEPGPMSEPAANGDGQPVTAADPSAHMP